MNGEGLLLMKSKQNLVKLKEKLSVRIDRIGLKMEK